jgi:uncharacterized HAD superfamily protein
MTTDRYIYVDFDDVLCQTARALVDVAASRFGKRVPFEEIHFFDLQKSFGLSEDETRDLIDCFHDGTLLQALEPVPHAVESIRQWSDGGYRIWVITGRPPDTFDVSRRWLERYEAPFEKLIMVDKYARNHAPRQGVPTMTLREMATLNCRLAVEDSLDMASFLLENTRIPVALLNRPWNTGPTAPPESARLHRCEGWQEVMRRFPRP